MSAGLGELFIQLAFQGDTAGAKKFKGEIDNVASSMNKAVKGSGNLKMGILGLVGTITGAIYALNRMTDSLITNNQAWISLGRQTDLALESLQGYAAVASVLDKSLGMQGAAQGIANLEQRLYELQLTGQGAQGFMYAGIDPRGKNAFQVIEALRQRIKGLNNNQATFLLKQMGIDPKMLGMLRMTRAEFEALNRELSQYQLTERQRKQLQKYSEQFEIARKKMQYFKDMIVLALVPALLKLTKGLTRVAEAFYTILKSDKPIAMLAKAIGLVTAAVIGLGAAIWAVTAHPIVALITVIIGAIMGLVVALGLIVEDIIVWAEGGDSVFGRLLWAIDQIVANPNVPEWIRKLWDIISHADKLKEIADKFEKDHPVISKLTKGKPAEEEGFWGLVARMAAGGTGYAIGNQLLPIPGGGLIGQLLGTTTRNVINNINQQNEIITSETGDAVMGGLQSVISLFGAGR